MKIFKRNEKKKGFTLIELVAVVAIIGILAALLVPKISGYIKDAKKTKVIDQARQIYMAVETRNIKEDKQLENETVGGALADETVKKYMGDATASDFEFLPTSMTIDQCKAIIEGVDFSIDNNGVFVATSTS